MAVALTPWVPDLHYNSGSNDHGDYCCHCHSWVIQPMGNPMAWIWSARSLGVGFSPQGQRHSTAFIQPILKSFRNNPNEQRPGTMPGASKASLNLPQVKQGDEQPAMSCCCQDRKQLLNYTQESKGRRR